MRRVSAVAAVLLVWLAVPASADGGSILFGGSGTGSDGITLNGEALFEITGTTLQITLRNTGDTSGSEGDKSANTLTGLFFDLPEGITLTPIDARIAEGALVQYDSCEPSPCAPDTTNVGGEFVYATGTWSGHAGGQGISSSGYISPDGGSGNFNGPNLDDPDSPDGVNFGIIAPLALSPFNPNGTNMSDNPLIEGEVVFTLAISGGTLLETQISNVSFQYGTSISEPKYDGSTLSLNVPEPSMLLLLTPMGYAIRRRFRRPRSMGRAHRA